MSALPSTSAAHRAAAPGASVALEQSLTRLPPRVMWPAQPPPLPVAQGRPDGARKGGESRDPTTRRAKRRAGSQAAGERRAKATSATAKGRAEAAALPTRIGVISDNHGYLDPAVLEIFAGVIHIIHAGDVMDPEILERLATVAPVTAVAGNMDSGQPTSALPREVVGEVAGVRFLVGHKRKRLLRDLAAGSIAGLAAGEAPDLVIYGHDHLPAAAWVEGTLYLDPGSASAPHEEDDGPTVAIVEVRTAGLSVCFVPLERRDAEEAKVRLRE
jgi:putative phosphoesterase